jgi:hypothetical protein
MTAEQLHAPEPLAPLETYVCLDCALIQVPDNVPPGFFSHYLYVSSSSDHLVRHFESFAGTIVERLLTPDNRRLTDIGSCDGVLLNAARALGADPLGIEPAANLAAIARAKGLDVINEYFSLDVANRALAAKGPMAAISMSNTFNVIDDLDAVVSGVRVMLADDGAFVVEVPQATDLIEHNEFDTIYHEHVSQFSVHSLAALFARHDMEIFDLEPLALHGGSMRTFVQKKGAGRAVSSRVAAALKRETDAGLFDEATYHAFRRRVEQNRSELTTLLRGLKSAGKTIAGYGAAAKGTTLLNYYGIGTDLLDFIADRNAMKHGLYSPGMHIPVVSTDAILDRRPDYLLILAWNFAGEIVAQQEEYARRGGRFILPIPALQVVDGARTH